MKHKNKKPPGPKPPRKTKGWRKLLWAFLLCTLLASLATLALNLHVSAVGGAHILPLRQAAALKDVDYIVVLGARVWPDGTPCHQLEDRVINGVKLYKTGVSPALLMSGDSQEPDRYDETGTMQKLAESLGVPQDSIVQDPLGLNTYASMLRLKEKFGARKIVIVTQRYHLLRAVFLARGLGLNAYGVQSDLRPYATQIKNSLREIPARAKDAWLVWKFQRFSKKS